jgi:hypothetical protein
LDTLVNGGNGVVEFNNFSLISFMFFFSDGGGISNGLGGLGVDLS